MDESVRYLKLTDFDNRGTVVKQVGRKSYDYFRGEWRRRAMMEYFNPDAPEYGCYEVIPEEEAMSIIKE